MNATQKLNKLQGIYSKQIKSVVIFLHISLSKNILNNNRTLTPSINNDYLTPTNAVLQKSTLQHSP